MNNPNKKTRLANVLIWSLLFVRVIFFARLILRKAELLSIRLVKGSPIITIIVVKINSKLSQFVFQVNTINFIRTADRCTNQCGPRK